MSQYAHPLSMFLNPNGVGHGEDRIVVMTVMMIVMVVVLVVVLVVVVVVVVLVVPAAQSAPSRAGR